MTGFSTFAWPRRRLGMAALALLAMATSPLAAPTPALAQDRAPGALAADFGGTWDAKDSYGARYTLSIQIKPDLSMTGDLTSIGGERYYGRGGKYAGTLTGSVSQAAVLTMNWLQPGNPNTQGKGWLKFGGDGTLIGVLVVRTPGSAPLLVHWTATRPSR